MAHLLAPQPPLADLPVFFNVDGAVGSQPAENRNEDVLLVQFAIQVLGSAPRPTTPPEVVAAAKMVTVTGVIDQATISAITAIQKALRARRGPSIVVDGRVSPARGSYSYAKSAPWIIADLNDVLQDRNVAVWPRIDQIPGCPKGLKDMVIRTVVGTL